MTNKEFVEKAIQTIGYTLGIYDEELNNLTKDELIKVVLKLTEDDADIEVMHNGIPYMVELETISGEKDLHMMPMKEYKARYHSED